MNAVCNASPLITLAKSGLLKILPSLFDDVVVVSSVVNEILGGPADDPARIAISSGLTWLRQVRIEPPITPLANLQLGAGEAEVIEWVLRNPTYVALLDDRVARRAGTAVGVKCCGTLAVLGMATKRGLLPSFLEAVALVRCAGLYVSDSVVATVEAGM